MAWVEQLKSANWNLVSWTVLGAYILGCFTTGYYLAKGKLQVDLRELGSGAVGARNAGRVLGWQGFIGTVLGDFAKGAVAVWAARYFGKEDWVPSIAMLAVVAGHIWPAQLRFRGGKGVCTSLGALAVYDVQLAVAFLVCFSAVFILMRRSVLPALCAFASLPLASAYLGHPPSKALTVCVLSGFVLVAHRKNLIDELNQMLERRNFRPKANHTHL